jgi:Redoxin
MNTTTVSLSARFRRVALVLGFGFLANLALAGAVGQAAPAFTLTDLDGKAHSLSDFKGKTVVLEWVNPQCPFVVKHYDKSGNLPATQKAATADGVVWLLINSAASGKQGDFDAPTAKAWITKQNVAATAYLRDSDGKVGKLYDARTTPHMFIINAEGTLVYAGAIDSVRSTKADDIAGAENYVKSALADLKSGSAVKTPSTQPYGCSVKY